MRTTLSLNDIIGEWIEQLDALPTTREDHRRKILLWHRWLASQNIDPRNPARWSITLSRSTKAESLSLWRICSRFVTAVTALKQQKTNENITLLK